MRLCKLTNAFLIVPCKVFGSLIRQLFPSYHRHSNLLKFQECSRAVQNALGGLMPPASRRLPTPDVERRRININ